MLNYLISRMIQPGEQICPTTWIFYTVNTSLMCLLISNTYEGVRLNREGGLIQFSKEDSISSPERTRMQSGKGQVQEVGGHVAEDQKQNRTSSCWINHCILDQSTGSFTVAIDSWQSSLINTVYHLSLNNNKGEAEELNRRFTVCRRFAYWGNYEWARGKIYCTCHNCKHRQYTTLSCCRDSGDLFAFLEDWNRLDIHL